MIVGAEKSEKCRHASRLETQVGLLCYSLDVVNYWIRPAYITEGNILCLKSSDCKYEWY